jgi:hypothetical protein
MPVLIQEMVGNEYCKTIKQIRRTQHGSATSFNSWSFKIKIAFRRGNGKESGAGNWISPS